MLLLCSLAIIFGTLSCVQNCSRLKLYFDGNLVSRSWIISVMNIVCNSPRLFILCYYYFWIYLEKYDSMTLFLFLPPVYNLQTVLYPLTVGGNIPPAARKR